MRNLLLLTFFLLISSWISAQEKLYYYYGSADSSTIGVRNDRGEVVIKPQKYFFGIDEKEEIEGATIDFFHFPIDGEYPEIKNYVKDSPVIPCGLVYNRKGEFLYFPQLFDNGPDYFSEGVRRYVADGKIGFVDALGNKVTPAKWGFAGIFNYGYASVDEGELLRKYEDGGERWTVVPANKYVVSYLINIKGERVEPMKKKNHPKDYFYEGLYYPYPFHYSKEEQNILDKLNKDIVGITLMYKLSAYQYEYEPMQLEIIERPNAYAPYYVVTAFDDQKELDDALIYIDVKTSEAYLLNYDKEKVSLKEAMLESIEENLTRDKDYINIKTRKLADTVVKRLKSHF